MVTDARAVSDESSTFADSGTGLRHQWQALSRQRKAIWVVALGWAALHLLGLAGMILAMPDFTRSEARAWSDLATYLDAVDDLQAREPLYDLDPWDDVMTYHYHPTFALAFSSLAWLPFRGVALIWFVLQVAAYFVGLRVWYRVLQALDVPHVTRIYSLWLPLTLVFSEFYANLAYANIAALLFLLSGLLALALVRQQTAWAIPVATLILLLKPQWLFPLLIPVVIRQWRVLVMVLAGVVMLYALVNGLYLIGVGPDYGLDTLQDYGRFLTRLNANYPWKGDSGLFEDMNHSWRQIFLSYFGFQDWVPTVSELVKAIMIAALGFSVLRAWQRGVTLQSHPTIVLWFLAAGYLLSMAMLAQLWELFAGIIFFIIIQATDNRHIRQLSWLFLVYVFYELFAIVSFSTGFDGLFLPQTIPLTMLALVVLFVSFIVLINQTLAEPDEENVL